MGSSPSTLGGKRVLEAVDGRFGDARSTGDTPVDVTRSRIRSDFDGSRYVTLTIEAGRPAARDGRAELDLDEAALRALRADIDEILETM